MLACVLAAGLSGCGVPETDPVQLAGPAPSPAAGEPASSSVWAYTIDPRSQTLVTFAVHPDTGQVRAIQSTAAPLPGPVTHDPDGRFLYLAGLEPPPRRGPSYARSYTIDPLTGWLTLASHERLPITTLTPVSMAANRRQLYVAGASNGTGTHGGWVSFDIDAASGRLGAGRFPPNHREPRFVVADPEGRFAYTDGEDWLNEYEPTVYAHALQDNGPLREIGKLVVPERVTAAVLGSDFLILSGAGALTSFGIDTATGLLLPVPHARRGAPGAALALSPDERLLAAGDAVGIAVYAVTDAGDLVLREQLQLPILNLRRHLAFHPGGGFLYASGAGEGVQVYRVAPDGRLALTGGAPEGGGAITVLRVNPLGH